MHATIEVCVGKACSRAGSQEVLSVVRAGLPNGWNVQPGRKCMGMCKRACVVRVTGDTDQVVHTNVTPSTAAITVLPGRSYPAFPSPMPAASALAPIPKREVVIGAAAGAGAGAAAASGFFEAAAAAVETGELRYSSESENRGGGDSAADEGGGEEGLVKKKKRSNSEVLRAARMASQRIESMDIAAYDTDKIDCR